MTTKKQRKHRRAPTARIYYGVDAAGDHLYWTVRVIQGKHRVEIDSTLADAIAGKPGMTIGCHLSRCAQRNAKAFTHPCKLAAFNKSSALIVSKIVGGTPKYAVKYAHSMGKLVDLNDKDAAKTFIKKHPELAERTFVLRPPRKHRKIAGTHGGSGKSGERFSVVPRGALKRAQDAGLITADLQQFVYEVDEAA